MSSAQQDFQPKSILFRNADFTQYISAGMGIIDFGAYFDNEMSKNKFILKFIDQIQLAIKHKVCKVPKGYEFPVEEARNIDSIWNGTCFYGVKRNPFSRTFLYSKPKPPVVQMNTVDQGYDEFIQLPKFRNMIPNQKIADETLLIQIREALPLRYAFQSSDYVTLINDAGLMHVMSDGQMPKFTREDMQSLTVYSYFITRPVFNSLMEDFEHFFNKNWNIISISLQKIIDFAEMGGSEDDEEDSGAGSFVTQVD